MYARVDGYSGNAWTAEKGAIFVHPMLRSVVGVTEQIDIKLNVGGFILGPNLGVELAAFQGERRALSFEAGVDSRWDRQYMRYSGTARYGEATGEGVFNLSLGVGGSLGDLGLIEGLIDDDGSTSLVRFEVGYDFIVSDRARFVTTARTNLLALSSEVFEGALGGFWFYGYRGFGASLGVNVLMGQTAIRVGEFYQPEAPIAWAVLPSPHVQFWFRI